MPPKTKKRKVKESEEELLLKEKLIEAFFKYRHEASEDAEDDDENVGMFGAEEDEIPKIHVSDMERVANEVGVEWDEAVMAILDQDQIKKETVDIETMKLVIATLKTVEKQQNDIEYLFKTFSESGLITHESLARALKHLSIRESADKIALLMAFAHEQSFLQLVLNEQTTGKPMAMIADRSGITYKEFKRTFMRSAFISNK